MVYRPIPDTEIDQGSPVTVPLMTALRDNLTEVASGDSTAPEVNARAQTYRTVYGAGNIVTFSSLDGFGGMWADIEFTNGNYFVQFSTDGGSTFSTLELLFAAVGQNTGRLFINFADGDYKLISINISANGTITGMTGGVTDFRFDGSGASTINILASFNRGEAA